MKNILVHPPLRRAGAENGHERFSGLAAHRSIRVAGTGAAGCRLAFSVGWTGLGGRRLVGPISAERDDAARHAGFVPNIRILFGRSSRLWD
jgi:hypothetical protein